MVSEKLIQYYDSTADRAVRPDLRLGVELVQGERRAIDCGCGAGRDVDYLRSEGFSVRGFDVEEEAIARCRRRFDGDPKVDLQVSTFSSFDYGDASLVLADASLFFCPPEEFDAVWQKISAALYPEGVFVGSFLGTEDSMAGPDYEADVYWPDVLTFDPRALRARFGAFDIVRWTEIRRKGRTPTGEPHDWHIFSIVASKR